MDTLGHVLAARGAPRRAALAFVDSARLGGPDHELLYRERLAALGIEAAPGPGGLKAALIECAAGAGSIEPNGGPAPARGAPGAATDGPRQFLA